MWFRSNIGQNSRTTLELRKIFKWNIYERKIFMFLLILSKVFRTKYRIILALDEIYTQLQFSFEIELLWLLWKWLKFIIVIAHPWWRIRHRSQIYLIIFLFMNQWKIMPHRKRNPHWNWTLMLQSSFIELRAATRVPKDEILQSHVYLARLARLFASCRLTSQFHPKSCFLSFAGTVRLLAKFIRSTERLSISRRETCIRCNYPWWLSSTKKIPDGFICANLQSRWFSRFPTFGFPFLSEWSYEF